MFCQKCGAKLPSDAEFCIKCGLKLPHDYMGDVNDTYENVKIVKSRVTEKREITTVNKNSMPARVSLEKQQNAQSELDGFRDYVDNYVQKSTGYNSAKELLNRKVSVWFVWICYIVPIAIGLIICAVNKDKNWLAFILIPAFLSIFGYFASCLVLVIKRTRFIKDFSFEIDNKINIDALLAFMNTHLNYLNPYFGKWDYWITTKDGEEILENNGLVVLGSVFDKSGSQIAQVRILPDANDNSIMTCDFIVVSRLMGTGLVRSYKNSVNAVPILQASFEYFLYKYNNEN